MSRILPAFLDELEKSALAGRMLLKAVKKRPWTALGVASTGALAGTAAARAYKQGRSGEQKPRYLHAAVDPVTGRAMGSRAAYTNYNRLFPGKPTDKDRKRLHGKYKEDAFRRYA